MATQAIESRVRSRKSLLQVVLESVSGRDLDPTRVTYSNRSEPVGKGYYQTVTVRKETNLRTGKTGIEEERGAIV